MRQNYSDKWLTLIVNPASMGQPFHVIIGLFYLDNHRKTYALVGDALNEYDGEYRKQFVVSLTGPVIELNFNLFTEVGQARYRSNLINVFFPQKSTIQSFFKCDPSVNPSDFVIPVEGQPDNWRPEISFKFEMMRTVLIAGAVFSAVYAFLTILWVCCARQMKRTMLRFHVRSNASPYTSFDTETSKLESLSSPIKPKTSRNKSKHRSVP